MTAREIHYVRVAYRDGGTWEYVGSALTRAPAPDRLALARALVADMPGVVVAAVPSQRDLAWEINQGLGTSWAYSDYSGNEWEQCRDMLDSAADAVRSAIIAAGSATDV